MGTARLAGRSPNGLPGGQCRGIFLPLRSVKQPADNGILSAMSACARTCPPGTHTTREPLCRPPGITPRRGRFRWTRILKTEGTAPRARQTGSIRTPVGSHTATAPMRGRPPAPKAIRMPLPGAAHLRTAPIAVPAARAPHPALPRIAVQRATLPAGCRPPSPLPTAEAVPMTAPPRSETKRRRAGQAGGDRMTPAPNEAPGQMIAPAGPPPVRTLPVPEPIAPARASSRRDAMATRHAIREQPLPLPCRRSRLPELPLR